MVELGTVWTAVAHIVTGVIGSGVLSLAWSISQLGWIAGPLAMLLFASVTLFSSFLLSNTYRSPDPEYGPHRHPSYLNAVNLHLGNYGYPLSFQTSLCFLCMCFLTKIPTPILVLSHDTGEYLTYHWLPFDSPVIRIFAVLPFFSFS